MFDNTEDILNYDGEAFKLEVGKMIDEFKILKILVTSWQLIEKLEHVKEYVVDLEILTPK